MNIWGLKLQHNNNKKHKSGEKKYFLVTLKTGNIFQNTKYTISTSLRIA